MKLAPMNPAPPVTRIMTLFYLERGKDLSGLNGLHASRPRAVHRSPVAAPDPSDLSLEELPLVPAWKSHCRNFGKIVPLPEDAFAEQQGRSGPKQGDRWGRGQFGHMGNPGIECHRKPGPAQEVPELR